MNRMRLKLVMAAVLTVAEVVIREVYGDSAQAQTTVEGRAVIHYHGFVTTLALIVEKSYIGFRGAQHRCTKMKLVRTFVDSEKAVLTEFRGLGQLPDPSELAGHYERLNEMTKRILSSNI